MSSTVGFLLILSSFMISSCEGKNCSFSQFEIQANFDTQRFLGRWYEMKWRSQNYIPENELFQDYSHYYVMESNGTISAYVTGRNPEDMTTCFRYTVWLLPTGTPGKMSYRRWISNTELLISDYWVMMTDYDNYAFIYGCRVPFENGTCNEADSWIWSRTASLPNTTLALIEEKILDLCLDLDSYLSTRQDNECPECRYMLIDGVQDFDISKYSGTWYELRVYRQSNFSMAGNKDMKHKYTVLDDNSASVQITSRDMTNAKNCKVQYADLSKTDQKGKFKLNSKSGNNQKDYWVISTDYNNFAVVYSCLTPGDNLKCKDAEITVFGRSSSLNSNMWAKINSKIKYTCVDPNKYVTVKHEEDCVVSSGNRHQQAMTAVLYFLAFTLFMMKL